MDSVRQSLSLSDSDYKLLHEALECLNHKQSEGNLFGALFTGLIAKDDAQREEMERKMKEEEAKKAGAVRQKKEDILLLTAKLIQIRRFQSAQPDYAQSGLP